MNILENNLTKNINFVIKKFVMYFKNHLQMIKVHKIFIPLLNKYKFLNQKLFFIWN